MYQISRESNLIQGNVLDVGLSAISEAVKRYEPRLYFKWNPKKREYKGCWELRIKPTEKRIVETINSPVGVIHVLEAKEYNWVNHVKDFETLDYRILDWMFNNDGFRNEAAHKHNQLAQELEKNIDGTRESHEKAKDSEWNYVAKQTVSEWRKVKEDLNSGKSLARALSERGF